MEPTANPNQEQPPRNVSGEQASQLLLLGHKQAKINKLTFAEAEELIKGNKQIAITKQMLLDLKSLGYGSNEITDPEKARKIIESKEKKGSAEPQTNLGKEIEENKSDPNALESMLQQLADEEKKDTAREDEIKAEINKLQAGEEKGFILVTEASKIADEYKKYVDLGVVSKDRFDAISQKMKNNEPVTPEEIALHTGYQSHLDNLDRIAEKIKNGEQRTNKELQIELEHTKEIGNLLAQKKAFETKESIKNSIDGKEKKELSKEAASRINTELGKFGIGPEQVKQIPEWEYMDEGQRLLAIELYKNFFVENVAGRAEEQFKEKMASKGWLGKMWMKMTKTEKMMNYKKSIYKNWTSGENAEETTRGLSEKAFQVLSYNFKVNTEGGKLRIDFAQTPEGLEKGKEKVYEHFNEVATKFQTIPEEWNTRYATKAQKEAYKNAKDAYSQALESLRTQKEAELGEQKAAEFMITADSQMQLARFDLANPDLSSKMEELSKGFTWSEVFTSKRVTMGALSGLGWGARKAFWAVGVGSVIGGARNYFRAKWDLKEQDYIARRGGTETKVGFFGEIEKIKKAIQLEKDPEKRNALQKRRNEIERSMLNSNTKDQTIQSTTDLASRINKILNQIQEEKSKDNGGDKEVILALTRKLQSRIDYTETKMLQGRVNDGVVAVRSKNRFELINMLKQAKTTALEVDLSEKLQAEIARTEKLTGGKMTVADKKLAYRRAKYIGQKIAEGAAIGGAVAYGAGWIREHWDGWFGHHTQTGGGTPVEDGNSTFVTDPEKVTSPSYEVPNNAFVKEYGDSFERIARRQIDTNYELAKALGYTGPNDPDIIHKTFSGGAAHRLAMDEGYFKNINEQVGIKGTGIDRAAYELRVENGKVTVHEWFDGKETEVHTSGTVFEGKDGIEKEYEYMRNTGGHKTISQENLRTGVNNQKIEIKDIPSGDDGTNEIPVDGNENQIPIDETDNEIPVDGNESISAEDIAQQKAYEEHLKKLEKIKELKELQRAQVENSTRMYRSGVWGRQPRSIYESSIYGRRGGQSGWSILSDIFSEIGRRRG